MQYCVRNFPTLYFYTLSFVLSIKVDKYPPLKPHFRKMLSIFVNFSKRFEAFTLLTNCELLAKCWNKSFQILLIKLKKQCNNGYTAWYLYPCRNPPLDLVSWIHCNWMFILLLLEWQTMIQGAIHSCIQLSFEGRKANHNNYSSEPPRHSRPSQW